MSKISGYIKFLFQLLNPLTFFPTVFYNFYYLPLRQAIVLPIWIHKPHFVKFYRGGIRIEADKIKPGMIRLGFWGGHMYPNNGITITNEGLIVFKGECVIGNNSFIVTGVDSVVEFGDDFIASTSFKLVSFIGIKFEEHNRIGWECTMMDTNFHPLYDLEKKQFKKAYGKICIGKNNWFGTQCLVMHSVTTPEFCIFGARSILTRGGRYESYCVHGGSPIKVLSRNVARIIGQDRIKKYK